jgi:hypothetical protein
LRKASAVCVLGNPEEAGRVITEFLTQIKSP